MRVWIQLGRGQGATGETGFVGGFVEPCAAEEARPLDDVELTELRRDHPGDAEPGDPHVGARHVDGIRRHATPGELRTDRLDALEDVRTAQMSDLAGVATLRRGIEEAGPRSLIGMGVEQRVPVEASYLLGHKIEIVRTLERLVAHPAPNGERLGEGFPPGNADSGGRCPADAERRELA